MCEYSSFLWQNLISYEPSHISLTRLITLWWETLKTVGNHVGIHVTRILPDYSASTIIIWAGSDLEWRKICTSLQQNLFWNAFHPRLFFLFTDYKKHLHLSKCMWHVHQTWHGSCLWPFTWTTQLSKWVKQTLLPQQPKMELSWMP